MDKPTYVSALGLGAAKSLARELREDAMEAIEPFGKRAVRLQQLADFIVMREF
jgi:farnesyl diphosphate synthase